MDTPVVVASTDEDELVDIEGDDSLPCNEGSVVSSDLKTSSSEAKEETAVPFLRQPIHKPKKTSTELVSDDDLANWWKSAGDFQQTVAPDNTATNVDQSNEKTEETSANPDYHPSRLTRNDRIHPFDDKIYDDFGEPFVPPEKEIVIEPEGVTEDEREKFPEFFSGRTRYSPHNYLSIRNTILKLWEERKPNHVNKVSLRPILRKTSGNVNNIGKVHRYLESIGAINFGSDAVWWKRRRRRVPIYRPPKSVLDTDDKLKRALEQRMSGRNRKRPSTYSPEISLNDMVGGYTIDHANNKTVHITKSVKKLSGKRYSLKKCLDFSSSEECPFVVTVDSAALIVMDVHSHLSIHEVMGLIGGEVSIGSKVNINVKCAEPCKSSGSFRHCEMDPVSQSAAGDRIASRNLKVIGWYHSHPTFLPQPSQTDITTQMEKQAMFSAHDSVFLGVILTPYYKHQLKTIVNIVHVGHGGTPYSVPYRVHTTPPNSENQDRQCLLDTLETIVKESAVVAANGKTASRLHHLIDPVIQGSTVTHLIKIFRSLSSHIRDNILSEFPKVFPMSAIYFGDVATESDIPMPASSCEIATQSLHSEDGDTDESYSIDQNFPSLQDNGIVCPDDACGDVCDDVKTPKSSSDVVGSQKHDSMTWESIFYDIKALLLKKYGEISLRKRTSSEIHDKLSHL